MKLGNIFVQQIICILFNPDKNTKRDFWRHAKRWGCPHIDFYTPKSNDVLQTHIDILRELSRKRVKNALIIEDSVMFMQPLALKLPPRDWSIIHIGGDVAEVLAHVDDNYKRVKLSSCFAYIVNQSAYATLLKTLTNPEIDDIDEGFARVAELVPNYITTPPIVVQHHNQCIKDLGETPEELDAMPVEKSGEYCTLRIPEIPINELPPVSLIAIVRNKSIAPLVIRNFYKTKYGENRDNLQLIIIDYCKGGLRDIIPANDKRIKHVDLSAQSQAVPAMTDGQLYNTAIKYADHDYILHMSEMIYYTPDHAAVRMRILLGYSGIDVARYGESPLNGSTKACIGCTRVGYFDMAANVSYYMEQADINNHKCILQMGSLAYTRQFWEANNYQEDVTGNVGIAFIRGRYHEVMTIPYEPIMLCLSYKSAPTMTEENKPKTNFVLELDEETQEFIMCIKNILVE